MIGIHTPEFDFEKSRERVVESTKQHDLSFPVMMDNDYSYWKKLNNNFWPTFYLVNQQGQMTGVLHGETHPGTPKAKQVEDAIDQLLAQ